MKAREWVRQCGWDVVRFLFTGTVDYPVRSAAVRGEVIAGRLPLDAVLQPPRRVPRPGLIAEDCPPGGAQLPPWTSGPGSLRPVPPTETPHPTREKDTPMTEHITADGHQVYVIPAPMTDSLWVTLRRNRGGVPEHAWVAPPTMGPARLEWRHVPDVFDPDTRHGLTPEPGVTLRHDDARAIVDALSEALGLPPALAEQTELVAHLTAELEAVTAERDNARREAALNGARWELTMAQLDATRETLALVREWHTDTRRRLERAEAPPIMVTLDTATEPDPRLLDRMARVPQNAATTHKSTGTLDMVRHSLERMVADHGGSAVGSILFQVNREAARVAGEASSLSLDGVPLPSVRNAMSSMSIALVDGGVITEDQAQSVNGLGELTRLLVDDYRRRLSTPVDEPVEATHAKGSRVEDSNGDVWVNGDDRAPGWWHLETQDSQAMHRLAWITEAWGPVAPLED